MFQMRYSNGAIREFARASDMMSSRPLPEDMHTKNFYAEDYLEKVSFDAEDGTRVRLVHQGNGLFEITIWNGAKYEQF